MEKGSVIACQVSYLPIQSPDLDTELANVLAVIKAEFPDCEIGEFSTIVKGPVKKVFHLMTKLIEKMDSRGSKFNIQVSLSNICGCAKN